METGAGLRATTSIRDPSSLPMQSPPLCSPTRAEDVTLSLLKEPARGSCVGSTSSGHTPESSKFIVVDPTTTSSRLVLEEPCRFGCGYTVVLDDRHTHEFTCPMSLTLCTACNDLVPRHQLLTAHKESCGTSSEEDTREEEEGTKMKQEDDSVVSMLNFLYPNLKKTGIRSAVKMFDNCPNKTSAYLEGLSTPRDPVLEFYNLSENVEADHVLKLVNEICKLSPPVTEDNFFWSEDRTWCFLKFLTKEDASKNLTILSSAGFPYARHPCDSGEKYYLGKIQQAFHPPLSTIDCPHFGSYHPYATCAFHHPKIPTVCRFWCSGQTCPHGPRCLYQHPGSAAAMEDDAKLPKASDCSLCTGKAHFEWQCPLRKHALITDILLMLPKEGEEGWITCAQLGIKLREDKSWVEVQDRKQFKPSLTRFLETLNLVDIEEREKGFGKAKYVRLKNYEELRKTIDTQPQQDYVQEKRKLTKSRRAKNGNGAVKGNNEPESRGPHEHFGSSTHAMNGLGNHGNEVNTKIGSNGIGTKPRNHASDAEAKVSSSPQKKHPYEATEGSLATLLNAYPTKNRVALPPEPHGAKAALMAQRNAGRGGICLPPPSEGQTDGAPRYSTGHAFVDPMPYTITEPSHSAPLPPRSSPRTSMAIPVVSTKALRTPSSLPKAVSPAPSTSPILPLAFPSVFFPPTEPLITVPPEVSTLSELWGEDLASGGIWGWADSGTLSPKSQNCRNSSSYFCNSSKISVSTSRNSSPRYGLGQPSISPRSAPLGENSATFGSHYPLISNKSLIDRNRPYGISSGNAFPEPPRVEDSLGFAPAERNEVRLNSSYHMPLGFGGDYSPNLGYSLYQ